MLLTALGYVVQDSQEYGAAVMRVLPSAPLSVPFSCWEGAGSCD